MAPLRFASSRAVAPTSPTSPTARPRSTPPIFARVSSWRSRRATSRATPRRAPTAPPTPAPKGPAPDGGQHVIRMTYRSANVFYTDANNPLRESGALAYFKFRGPDLGAITQFRIPQTQAESNMDSLNSFGNLETIPPYTLGGLSY